MLSGGRGNHRDAGQANCSFVCVKYYVRGGDAPCLPTMLQAERDVKVHEEVTVSYGPNYGLDDLTKWVRSDEFCQIVGQCRVAGMDVYSSFGEYLWSVESTFYCQAWEAGQARPVPLAAIDRSTVSEWKTEGVRQVFLVNQGSVTFGCAVYGLEDDPNNEGNTIIMCMGGVHHVLLPTSKVGG